MCGEHKIGESDLLRVMSIGYGGIANGKWQHKAEDHLTERGSRPYQGIFKHHDSSQYQPL